MALEVSSDTALEAHLRCPLNSQVREDDDETRHSSSSHSNQYNLGKTIKQVRRQLVPPVTLCYTNDIYILLFLAMQTTIDAVQEAGLLGAVFIHLKYLEDILQCSAVSKTWAFVIQNLRPVSLIIPGSNPKLDPSGMPQVLLWVQRKQQQGHMKVSRGFLLSLSCR